jgi:hypothetical protein
MPKLVLPLFILRLISIRSNHAFNPLLFFLCSNMAAGAMAAAIHHAWLVSSAICIAIEIRE